MLSPCLALPPVECRDTADVPTDPPRRVLPIRRRKRRPGDWRPERPRERLLERGPAALTDDELIALLLGTGKPGHDVFVSARALVKQFGTLRGLLEATTDDFEAHPGIGPARSTRLAAVTEIARRMLKEKASERTPIDSPGAVEDYLRLKIGSHPHEVFVAVYLDARHGLIETEEITRGSLTRMAVYPREIVRRAMTHNAAALIVAHNHPSGAVQPSAEDRRLTRVLRDALELVDVRLLDHVVVGTSDTFSFARAGWL
ncbi:RadC family protein [Burkholderia sp. DN3021]|uniref:RadC family protein n=1 Tax=Burkholderia sp. DN3021 TaxID=3410137 RepID=UPI002865DFB7|nr:DNA repair protein RadC [Burkholderia ambifaria]MDR6502916.1 DNA repair protein RadC [Burkholderia ambifaria]